MIAVNGTLVARLARMTWHTLAPSVHRDGRLRLSSATRPRGQPRTRRGSSGLTTSLSASFNESSYLRAERPTSGLAVRQ